jgi:uncharacterized protein
VSANVQLSIPFKGLEDGWHNFIFNIDNKFFESFENSEIKKGNLKLSIDLYKSSHNLFLEYRSEGIVNIACDRCLEYFDLKLANSGKFYIKFSNESEVNDEGSITIFPKDDSVDIKHYIFESIILSLPSQRMHPLDINGKSTCNKEMIKKLKIYSSKKNKTKDIDSRWDKLKEIIN